MTETVPTQPISVLVVDDQTAIREAMTIVIDLQDDLRVVGSAGSGEDALAAVREHRPDVVLMDLNMPGMGGVQATAEMLRDDESIAVVVLTTYADDASILAALGAGARGYLTKDAGRADILRAIRAAAAGQAVLDPVVQQRLLAAATSAVSAARPSSPVSSGVLPADLTPREREVLTLIGRGLANRAIAAELFVSDSTVKTHINNLFAKLGVADRVEAVRLAISAGLVTAD